MRWSAISVPHFVKSYSLYNPNLWQLSFFVVPNIGSRVDNMRTFIFLVDDFTTYEDNYKGPFFANKSRWAVVPFALHPLFQ